MEAPGFCILRERQAAAPAVLVSMGYSRHQKEAHRGSRRPAAAHQHTSAKGNAAGTPDC